MTHLHRIILVVSFIISGLAHAAPVAEGSAAGSDASDSAIGNSAWVGVAGVAAVTGLALLAMGGDNGSNTSTSTTTTTTPSN
ncbi:hypothetical protein Y71_19660 [Kosakonia radicincitans DSM 16656]|uniref:Exopolysaccharide production protein YjbE n=1 Tax=Kosakonia radicincitans TaxID=283686 RepID=A0AAX2ELX9_9ENTR|nr:MULTISPECIES: exopolysaccharide production protein YjbE [Kosakonia]MDP9564924.1 hypothetical protein [Kosakonia oryzae]APG17075.1 hypothetical protein A3780_05705 [Kosakonia radicincitans]ARD62029.1 hypothetical protein Y71_19660 [Kosakonia radicincitans DSM 16656]KDE33731.1 hypothetical protein AW40_25740 [Kosakonia radicincitans UMEnt01/12]MDD7997142.1 exopolysaccharide production protein YjbE [Kosakonia radicincitans]